MERNILRGGRRIRVPREIDMLKRHYASIYPDTSEVNSEVDFVESPDELLCMICLSVAREPWQHGNCGRLFCEKCLHENMKLDKRCPNCRENNAKCFKDGKSKKYQCVRKLCS